TYPYPGHSQH
ncbi:hypothetical protein EC900091_1703, partial [Escherichia coli 90.0091]